MKKKDFCVIGSGSWGTALACMVARSSGGCLLYSIEQKVADEINKQQKNSRYLGDVILPGGVFATTDFSEIVNYKTIIIAVPSFAFADTLDKLKEHNLPNSATLLVATKGMCENPLQFFSERIEMILPNSYGFISGPNFAKEVAEGRFAAITISSKDLGLAQKYAKIFAIDNLETSVSDDVITVQIASLVKNIIAIKSGMMEAEGQGENARAWLISMALKEISIIANTLGGKAESLSLPAVVGDLVLTSYSKTSRNTKFGFNFHKNGYEKEYLKNYPILVEGVAGARLLKLYLEKYGLKLPVISSIIDKLN